MDDSASGLAGSLADGLGDDLADVGGDLESECPVRADTSLPPSSDASDLTLRFEDDRAWSAGELGSAVAFGRTGDWARGELSLRGECADFPRGIEGLFEPGKIEGSFVEPESEGDLRLELLAGLSVRLEDTTSDCSDPADCDAGDVHWDCTGSELGRADSCSLVPVGVGDRTGDLARCGESASLSSAK